MKITKGRVAIGLLLVSWLVLFAVTSERTPWRYYREKFDSEQVAVVSLGDVPVQNYGRMGFTRAIVRFVPGLQGWVIGTENGEVLLFDLQGTQLWKWSTGIGKITSLEVNSKGTKIVVGEQSPSGQVYVLDAQTGRTIWQFATAEGVGTAPEIKSYPGITHVSIDANDHVYVNVARFVVFPNGEREHKGRIYAFDANGTINWRYPKYTAMDVWANWSDISGQTGPLVFSTTAYDVRPDSIYSANLYWLERNSGNMLQAISIGPANLVERTVARCSPNFSADGKLFALMSSDGRAFVYSVDGKLLWERMLSTVYKINNSWINAVGRDAYIRPEGIVFATLGTYNRDNWQLSTPVEHPAADSIFVFDYDGVFKSQWRAGGAIEDISFADKLMAAAIGRNVQGKRYSVHGAAVLEISSGQVLSRFQTDGPCQAVAISADGYYLAAVEAPAALKDGRIIGAYQLHIWKLVK